MAEEDPPPASSDIPRFFFLRGIFICGMSPSAIVSWVARGVVRRSRMKEFRQSLATPEFHDTLETRLTYQTSKVLRTGTVYVVTLFRLLGFFNPRFVQIAQL